MATTTPHTYYIIKFYPEGIPVFLHKGDVFYNAFLNGGLMYYRTFGRAVNKTKRITYRRKNTPMEICAVKPDQDVREAEPVAVFENGNDITAEHFKSKNLEIVEK